MRACSQCVYHRHTQGPSGYPVLNSCKAPENRHVDLVSGNTFPARSCAWLRSDWWLTARIFNTCGREGRWWKPKPSA